MRRARLQLPVLLPVLFAIFLVLLGGAGADESKERRPEVIPAGPTPKEVELGKKYSREVEKDKQFKLVKDEERTRELNGLAKEIGAVSGRPKFEYLVKIYEDREPNAFTLPGGHVYVTTGLLDFVRSEHELAAVLAHEIAHNARMHQLKMSAKENRFMWLDLLTLVGAMAASRSQTSEAYRTNDPSKIYAPFLFQNALMQGMINRYSVEYETEADSFAFDYLTKTNHSPVALLTFMERLHQLDQRRPANDPGVYMTHPRTKERVDAAYQKLRQMGIPLNRSAVTAGPKPHVEIVEAERGSAAQVVVGDYVLFKLAGRTENEARARAAEAADHFEHAMLKGLRSFDLHKAAVEGGGAAVTAGKEVLVVARAEDAALNKTDSADTLAQKWIDNIRRLLLRGTLGTFSG